jgi:hypothetical protein
MIHLVLLAMIYFEQGLFAGAKTRRFPSLFGSAKAVPFYKAIASFSDPFSA